MALLYNLSAQVLFERPARARSIHHYADVLERSGREVTARIASLRHTQINHATATYVIAVERWGQQRLRVAQGAGFRPDDYTHYRPPADTGWTTLAGQFDEARQQTVVLAHDLANRNTDGKVLHERFGEMSIHAWLHYLEWHARVTLFGLR